jgi:drug/metabolite transporter (DMT)-like permease
MTSIAGRALPRRRALALLVLAAACFGVDTTLSAYALDQLRPVDLFVTETVVGALAVWATLAHTGHRPPARLHPYLVLGLMEPGVAYLFFDFGLRHTTATNAGLLASTDTLLAVTLAVAILRERIRAVVIAALVAGVIGTVLVSTSGGAGHATLTGNVLVLAGALIAGSYYVVARRLPTLDDTLTGTGYQLFSAAAVALAVAAVAWPSDGSSLPTASAAHLAVAGMTGIVGVALPYYLLNRAIPALPTSATAITQNLIPVFAVVSAVALLGESVTVKTVVGGSLIVSSLVVAGRTQSTRSDDQQ